MIVDEKHDRALPEGRRAGVDILFYGRFGAWGHALWGARTCEGRGERDQAFRQGMAIEETHTAQELTRRVAPPTMHGGLAHTDLHAKGACFTLHAHAKGDHARATGIGMSKHRASTAQRHQEGIYSADDLKPYGPSHGGTVLDCSRRSVGIGGHHYVTGQAPQGGTEIVDTHDPQPGTPRLGPRRSRRGEKYQQSSGHRGLIIITIYYSIIAIARGARLTEGSSTRASLASARD